MTAIATTKPIEILLADDDRDDRYFFEKALDSVSVATHLNTVNDGEQLMQYLHNETNQMPDIIFLDLNMPRKNGVECLAEIKANKQLKGIPVVLYSTSLRQDIANELYDGGAHYYLHKCDYPALVICIERIVALLAESPEQPTRNNFILSMQEVQA